MAVNITAGAATKRLKLIVIASMAAILRTLLLSGPSNTSSARPTHRRPVQHIVVSQQYKPIVLESHHLKGGLTHPAGDSPKVVRSEQLTRQNSHATKLFNPLRCIDSSRLEGEWRTLCRENACFRYSNRGSSSIFESLGLWINENGLVARRQNRIS